MITAEEEKAFGTVTPMVGRQFPTQDPTLSRLFGSILGLGVRRGWVFGGSPGQDVGDGICNESRSSSSPLPKSEHDSKEKSCQSSE